ncbi:winged helix-turn-helix transcriptional regulator [Agrobacterium rhizogenes]|uniref:sugar-binding transcriptional regulator n=1 Tax=Rhizobium rhizogenes TaxID=359 RepID=UPI0015733DC1|nr:sugar-binding domain-containing protein [Rhizobium rhizogenes]NTG51249.1 winged helix-turn-helix transcriptional regulator [Rhizobium rhizogenes]
MVAKLHYQSDMSQVDIAKKLGLSTATVSRLLQKARLAGIVRIEVIDLSPSEDLSAALIDGLKLRNAAVIDTPSSNVLSALAPPVGSMLQQAGLHSGSTLGIGWGRAVREVTLAGLPQLPGIVTIALNGGMQQAAAHFQTNEFVRQAAEQMGGLPHFLHAPYISSSELRDAFLADPTVQQVTALWNKLDAAIVGVGLTHAANPSEATAALPGEKALSQAAGDVLRHYVTEAGEILHWDGEERMIAATPEQLRRVPLCIAVAATPAKAPGIIGAARSGMINALVTDANTAQAILDRLSAGPQKS